MSICEMNLIELLGKAGPQEVLFAVVLSLLPLTRWVLPRFGSKNAVAAFHLIFGGLAVLVAFRARAIFAVTTAIIGYLILEMPPPVVVVIMFLVNGLTHIYCTLHSSGRWSMEVTAVILILFQKVISVSYNLHDGKVLKRGETLKHDRFKEFQLKEKPSFFYWLAYCFTPYGGPTGPWIEYKCFLYLIEIGERTTLTTPLDRKRANWRFITSLIQAGLHLYFGRYVSYELYRSEFYLGSHLLVRLLLMNLICTYFCIKYFIVWHAVEAGLFESGLNQVCDSDNWSNLTIVEILGSSSFSEFLRNWNHTAHIFWKNYLFLRLLDRGISRVIAYNAVFICSSVWHGCRAVYFLVLPETTLYGLVDGWLCKQIPVNRFDPWWKNVLRHLWVITGMFSATCAWWSNSWEVFVYIHKTNYCAMVVIGLVLGFILKIFGKPVAKKRD
jgi:hypothetical protein